MSARPASSGPLYYLAYGSNLHPLRLRERVSSARFVGLVSLPGYRLSFSKRSHADGSGKCMYERVPMHSGCLHGAVYALDGGQRPLLDRHEGLGAGYHEQSVEVSLAGERLAAFTYAADADRVDRSLQPFDWYRELVLAGARFHRLPPAYVAAIEAVVAIPDPDAARASRQAALLARIQGERDPAWAGYQGSGWPS